MQQNLIANYTGMSKGVCIHQPVHRVYDISITQEIEERMGYDLVEM